MIAKAYERCLSSDAARTQWKMMYCCNNYINIQINSEYEHYHRRINTIFDKVVGKYEVKHGIGLFLIIP